jgi:hypothetical protein
MTVRWDQLRTMLWVRWRLTRNQWARSGQINAVITLIAAIIGLVLGLAGGIAGLLGGALGLAKASSMSVGLIWDGLVLGFLFFWTIGLITELQRAELIDLARMLHLPVCLREVFLLNYFSSLASMSLAVMLPGMAGLSIGLAVGRGPRMLLLLPLVCGFFLMITAWTYYLRGWLALLMINPRRRRAIIMGITLGFVLLVQVPNLLSNLWLRPSRQPKGREAPAREVRIAQQRQHQEKQMAIWITVHRLVPILWLPHGAKSLAEGGILPALVCAVGMIGLGAFGLQRAYRGTLNFYQGRGSKRARKAASLPRSKADAGTLFVERAVPWLPGPAAAMALANLRSMMRAPEVKMALSVNVVMFAVIVGGILLRGMRSIPDAGRPFVASGALVLTLLGLNQLLFNQFGFDREGFRALMLLPTPRKLVLLGKNLALLPVGLGVFLSFILPLGVLGRLPAWAVGAALFQFVGGFLGLTAAGNLVSILVPYRIAAGSLKPTKTKASTVALMMVVNMLFPLMLAPFVAPTGVGLLGEHLGWWTAAPVALGGSIVVAGLGLTLYWWTLTPLSTLLQRRERRILQAVTQEIE